MRRGSILLEIMVAIGIFVGVGMTILAVMGQGESALRLTRERQIEMDLARSAIAAVEAGLATPQNIASLVRSPAGSAPWLSLDAEDADSGTDDGSYELVANVEPTAEQGLSLLTVRVGAKRRGGAESSDATQMRQLVRLVPWNTSSSKAGGAS